MSRAGAYILDCQARDCSYNHDGRCRTIGTNVGGPEPLCDTFVNAGVKGGVMDTMAKVGACKVQECSHNTSLECSISGIRVALQKNRAFCVSYGARA